MELTLGEATRELVALTRDVLTRERVRDALVRVQPDGDPFDRARWARLAGAGLADLGLGVRESVAIVEEVGRVLLPESVVDSNIAVTVLRASGAPAGVADRVAGGATVAAWAADGTVVVAAPPDLIVGLRDGVAFLVRAAAVAFDIVDGRDRTRTVMHVDFGGAELETWKVDVDPVHLEQVRRILFAAEAVGAMDAALAMTVAYVKEREQFDRPIGAFQAVKHQCADAWVQVEVCRAAVELAAAQLDGHAPDSDRDVAAAVAVVIPAFLDVAGVAVHLHGGMGYAWESGCHLYVRRALATARLLGDRATHARLVLAALRGGGLDQPMGK